MLARTRWRVMVGFAAVGFCVAAPPILGWMFAVGGIFTFLACLPASVDLLCFHGDLTWKLFLIAAPLNAIVYAAVGYAFCLLDNQRIDAPMHRT